MLQIQTVEPRTFVLLERLQATEELAHTRLVGGTALALQIGHRTSIDLDLFGDVDTQTINEAIQSEGFSEFLIDNNSKTIKQYRIEGIKVDVVKYNHPWLREVVVENGVRLASMEDIAAMKINAITGRGSKKDFVDLYFLLQRFSLSQILEFTVEKYPFLHPMIIYKNLSYFLDADKQEMPHMFVNVTWEEVKQEMRKQIEHL